MEGLGLALRSFDAQISVIDTHFVFLLIPVLPKASDMQSLLYNGNQALTAKGWSFQIIQPFTFVSKVLDVRCCAGGSQVKEQGRGCNV